MFTPEQLEKINNKKCLSAEYLILSNEEIWKEVELEEFEKKSEEEKKRIFENNNKELLNKVRKVEEIKGKILKMLTDDLKKEGLSEDEIDFTLKLKDEILQENQDSKDQDPSIPIIDLDSDPFISNGLKLKSHQKQGQFKWDPKKIKLYLSDSQRDEKSISGQKLRKELEKQKVLNANLLDYLIKNPQLIPEDWKVGENGKTRYIFFWGTIYRDSSDSLYVRYLYWGGGCWRCHYYWLDDDWSASDPSAVLAS